MMSPEEAEARLGPLLERRAQDLAAVYLYGSVARGEARLGSDLDLAVLLAQEPPRTLEGLFLDLEGEIEAALGVPVQLVVLNTADPDLTHRVLRDGRLILDRDRSARIRFEVRARNEFFDLEPILRRYRDVGIESGRARA